MRELRRSAFTALSVSLLMAAAPAPAAFERQDAGAFTIAVDVNLVVFNVSVTDGRGQPVSGLSASDFAIREQNQPQTITSFAAENSSATVGLVIDSSSSMRDKRMDVVNAALAFAGASNAEDELFVVNFNENVYLGLPASIPFTNDLNQIRSALLGFSPAGMTALYDALALSLGRLLIGTRAQKALVVLSDGGDNASRQTLDKVLEASKRSSATIYTIGIYDEDDPDRNPGVLRKIADRSGGRAYFPSSLKDMNRVWREIAAGIRSQYTIGYHSTNLNRDGKFRKVTISARSRGRNLRVTTRDGYFAPSLVK